MISLIFIINSSDFEKIFLNNEDDSFILDTQFVIVSTRIKKKSNSNENIVIATNILYPEYDFFCVEPKSELAKEGYYRQLGNAKPFLSALIKGSIKKGYNIFFICSDNEWKTFGYLKYLKDYIIDTFSYPVYSYKKYVNGCSLYEYNEKYTLNFCNSILKNIKKDRYENLRRSEKGKYKLMREYKKYSRRDLIKRVKKIGVYHDGMSRSDMLDIIESFL